MTQICEKYKKNFGHLSFIAVIFVEFAVVFMNSTANMTKTTAMDTLIETHIQFMFIFIAVYFDVSQNCHTMAFSFGQTAIGTTTPTTRSFTIKVIFINILTIFLSA